MNTPWKRIEYRARSHTAVQAVASPDLYILWELVGSLHCRRVQSHAGGDWEGWVAQMLLATYADCRVEVEGR